jgi:hypothetical protein
VADHTGGWGAARGWASPQPPHMPDVPQLSIWSYTPHGGPVHPRHPVQVLPRGRSSSQLSTTGGTLHPGEHLDGVVDHVMGRGPAPAWAPPRPLLYPHAPAKHVVLSSPLQQVRPSCLTSCHGPYSRLDRGACTNAYAGVSNAVPTSSSAPSCGRSCMPHCPIIHPTTQTPLSSTTWFHHPVQGLRGVEDARGTTGLDHHLHRRGPEQGGGST